jgi:juvenile hormone epoxide hydrolase
LLFFLRKVIKRLTDKLADVKISDPLEDTAFDYGFNAKRLQQVLTYWKSEYLPKWSERQEYLNQFPQFTTNIQG